MSLGAVALQFTDFIFFNDFGYCFSPVSLGAFEMLQGAFSLRPLLCHKVLASSGRFVIKQNA